MSSDTSHHLCPQRNLNPESQSCKQKSQKPHLKQTNIKPRKCTSPNITQKNHAKFNNLFKGIKYDQWIPRLSKRVQIKGKKNAPTQTKKSQQTVSTFIFITLEIAHLISPQRPRPFNKLPRCKNIKAHWNFPYKMTVLLHEIITFLKKFCYECRTITSPELIWGFYTIIKYEDQEYNNTETK